MSSWVYIFSQFTPEALLFEGLIIVILCGGYAVFWVLRKRRFGVAESELPSGPVKAYLNELITNAEQLRIQLFGLLSTHPDMSLLQRNFNPSTTPQPSAENATIPSITSLNLNSDPNLDKKLAELETKLVEQNKAIDAITSDKAKVEKDLSDALQRAKAAASGGDNSSELAAMQQRIRELEEKLAEYSVIEDDLANLKRLQQENSLLKATLSSKGLPLPENLSNTGATPAALPQSEPNITQTPESPPGPSAELTPEPTIEPTIVPTAEPILEETPNAAPSSEDFAGLANQVENSLATPAAEEKPTETKDDKADADLVAEFEKMLNG